MDKIITESGREYKYFCTLPDESSVKYIKRELINTIWTHGRITVADFTRRIIHMSEVYHVERNHFWNRMDSFLFDDLDLYIEKPIASDTELSYDEWDDDRKMYQQRREAGLTIARTIHGLYTNGIS